MPELPEVETIRKDLEEKVKGKKVKEVIINKPKLIKVPSVEQFKNRLKEKIFTDFQRRGKFLLISLDTKEKLIIHLKLTGLLTYCSSEDPLLNSIHIIFVFSDKTHLRFNDQRQFGEFYLVRDKKEIKTIRELGIEPLSDAFTLSLFTKMVLKKKTKIKPLLMDQKFIAGIGNIYAAESLYQARIHPAKLASTLSLEEVKRLFRAIKEILKKAIARRGTSVSTYRDIKGKKGTYETKLKVYARKGLPCYTCNTPIKRIVLAGRGTYFCPKCQKM